MIIILIQCTIVFLFYAFIYFGIECIFNAIVTKPHNERINNIMQPKVQCDQKVHIIATVGFARLVMIPFAGVLGVMAYVTTLIPHLYNYWYFSIFVYTFGWGIYFTILEDIFGFTIFTIYKVRLWNYLNEPTRITEFTTWKHFGIWNGLALIMYGLNFVFSYVFK